MTFPNFNINRFGSIFHALIASALFASGTAAAKISFTDPEADVQDAVALMRNGLN